MEVLHRLLFDDPEMSAYAVLDGASVPDLLDWLYEQEPEYECLFTGELAPDVAEVAPYLVRLTPDSEFTAWLLAEGWGRHWGIFALSHEEDFKELRQHFRTLLVVSDAEGKPLRFRYYDPRVLRAFLPACNAEERAAMFGPVAVYLLEAPDAQQIMRFYRSDDGALQGGSPTVREGVATTNLSFEGS